MRRTENITGTKAATEVKAGQGRLSRAKKAVTAACGAAYLAVNGLPMTVFAASTGTTAITQPLDNLKTLVIAVIGAVGVIILAKNVMEFAQAYQQQDSSTMNSALKGIVAGVMMAGISTVLSFLGF
ncbi:MAG: electron transporter RnfA [Lachnospiraceae bacterium]|nr:electron transporter RnfA [Lachnospiraceae bacterium]